MEMSEEFQPKNERKKSRYFHFNRYSEIVKNIENFISLHSEKVEHFHFNVNSEKVEELSRFSE